MEQETSLPDENLPGVPPSDYVVAVALNIIEHGKRAPMLAREDAKEVEAAYWWLRGLIEAAE